MSAEDWSHLMPEEVNYLIRRLNQSGHDAWLVGGCVRDMFLGIKPDDYDVATSALPDQVIGLFDRCLETGIKHGTVTVILSGQSFEVTTYRSEGIYSDGRRPDSVNYEKNIIPDLARRDFTVNSMAWHPKQGLLDPFDGRKHLQERRLSCVGDAELRMTEDALRQLRAVRFSLTYSLVPDYSLLEAVTSNHDLITKLSAERIQTEMTRTGRAPFGIMIEYFSGTGLMSRIFVRILGIEVEDQMICRLLAGFIQPFWKKEQIWAVFVLAGKNAAVLEEIPGTEVGQFSLPISNWLNIANLLSPGKLVGMAADLVSRTRLSLHLARHTQAILMLIGVRFMLWSADIRYNLLSTADITDENKINNRITRIKLMLRSTSRLTHLDSLQTLIACDNAWEILDVLVDCEEFQTELKYERELMLRWRNFPDEFVISPSQLMIRGSDDVFSVVRDRRRIGILLERLLSKQLVSDRVLNLAEARSEIKKWVRKENCN